MTDALNNLLSETSRSFYLTLRVLPGAVRPQIGLAYLLARTTDTIADTDLVPLSQRLDALHALRDRILGNSTVVLDFGELARHHGASAERALLEQVEASLAALRDVAADDAQLIRDLLEIITSGQELDLKRFAGSAAAPAAVGRALAPNTVAVPATRALLAATGAGALPKIIALQTDAELDDYTYRVAGCVGEFWTKICRAHLFRRAQIDDAFLLTNGVRFGKGLQLVNILRDLPRDLRQGRCYIPNDRLAAQKLTPADLLEPKNESQFRPLYDQYLARAEDHLAAGWAYTNALPRGQARIRLACAWPILIGINTLKRLRGENMLDPDHQIKVSRVEVRALVVRSILACPFKSMWEHQFTRAK